MFDKLTKFWFFRKVAVRYESDKKIAYASANLVKEIARIMMSEGYPITNYLLIEMTPVKNFLSRKRRKKWSILKLFSLSLFPELSKIKLNEDSILTPSVFFKEQDVIDPTVNVLVRIPPKFEYLIYSALLSS